MKSQKKIFIAFLLNICFSTIELMGGILTHSIAILSDSMHDFGDSMSIGMSYLFEKKSKKKANNRYTYGYLRYSVLGGVITTFILLIGSGVVIYHAVDRCIHPIAINYNGVILLAMFGLIVNLVATYFTHGGESINQKAVNLHMLEDALGWVVVLLGSIIMRFTNWYIIDPILSIAVALFIIVNAIKNLLQILEIFLIKTPKNIDVVEIEENIKRIDGVIDVHHVHIWTLDGERHCATLHVVIPEQNIKIKEEVKKRLKLYGILHATVETEMPFEKCAEIDCHIDEELRICHHHH